MVAKATGTLLFMRTASPYVEGNGMRNNQPVTQQNIDYPESAIFITRTDPKGIITYANDAFVQVSGFSLDELLGHNHNIVRHPDMPAWAFSSLWETIASGHPWQGVVKNRTKSGDHYWVKATVSPIIEQGKISGYLSLRRKPAPSEIQAAEALYKNKTPPRQQRSLLHWFSNLSLQTKLHLLIQPLLLILLSLASYDIADHLQAKMLQETHKRADGIANQVIDGANMLMITGQISAPENRQLLLKKISSSGHIIGLRLVRTEQVARQFGPGLPEEQIGSDLERKVIADKSPHQELIQHDGKPVFRLITPYIASHDFHGTDCLGCHQVEVGSVNGASIIDIDLSEEFSEYHAVIIKLVIGQIALQLALFLFITWLIRRFITAPVAEIKQHLESLVNGNMSAQVNISGRDEMGEILCSTQSAKVLLGALVDQNSTMTRIIEERAQQLANAVSMVENSALQQTEAASHMTSAIEQMSQNIEQVAEHTSDVRQTSEHSHELSDNGRNIVQRVVDDMNTTSTAIINAAKTIRELGNNPVISRVSSPPSGRSPTRPTCWR
jgi:methyl-accepting chemotaxis protein/aerotaxis receptor